MSLIGLHRSAFLLCAASLYVPITASAAVDPDRFEKEVLVPACADPMQLEVLKDGRVLFIERAGPVKLYSPRDKRVTTIGRVPVELYCEVGLLGLAADPDFDRTRYIWLFHCPAGHRDILRLSRFTIRAGALSLQSEKKLFEYPIHFAIGCHHQGGGLAWGPDGCLYLGTGDNSYPIPELPVDQRPGQEHCDALRTSANSMDLRGKILRVRPRPDGGYDIPAGNLFPNGKQGRPEIYCMGIRNAFRLSVDPVTGWVYWGDVGPNVKPEFGIGPEGYDEFNQARTAGNFGWPMFVGPNEAYRVFDFETRKTGTLFDAKAPHNYSRNNTGLKDLPPAHGALVWYPTTETTTFSGMGAGGRAAMAGPVYRNRSSYDKLLKLPEEYDGALLAFDWMRYWVKLIRFDARGNFASIEPFAPGMTFRRPIEMKLGPDGTLYVIEFGDKWGGNTDSQIVRVTYPRGNRAPLAALSLDPPAGRHPLAVKLDGTNSGDKDRDPLQYEWRINDDSVPRASDPIAKLTFDKPGTYKIKLTVRDPHGASGTSERLLPVGNSPPALRIVSPSDGAFFDWNEPIPYRVIVDDPEEGSTEVGRIAPARVTVRTELRARGKSGAEESDPGLALMRRSNCFGCHSTTVASGGPPYSAVAAKYKNDPEARERLAKKVISGGTGVWGTHQMPAQSQLSLEQARLAVGWVLASSDSASSQVTIGNDCVIVAPQAPKSAEDLSRRWVITATFADNGAEGAPPIAAEETVTLLSRLQRAAFAEIVSAAEVVDELDGGERLVVRIDRGGALNFGRVDLSGIDRITIRAATTAECELELRSGSPDGAKLAEFAVAPTKVFREVSIPLASNPGMIDGLCIVATAPLLLNWIQFHESADAQAARALRSDAARERQKILAAFDKPSGTSTKWTVAEIEPHLAEVNSGRSRERGWAIFRRASCVNCHRLGGLGGETGPDLTDVWSRMAKQSKQPRLALLHELVEPSRVLSDAYKPTNIATIDGRLHLGIVVSQNEETIRLRRLPPAPPDVIEIRRADIDEMAQLNTSPMPDGLLDTLTLDEILDLIALLESGGKPDHPAFRK